MFCFVEIHETVQQKAKRAGDTLRRSLRRIPRPSLNLNLRSPSSYAFGHSSSTQENGGDGKTVTSKTIAEEGEVELTGQRSIATPSKDLNGNLTNQMNTSKIIQFSLR